MSSIEPIDTNALKPTRSLMLQSRMAVHSAPLWLMNATLPGRAMSAANVAFSPFKGFITPRQFGPMMRIRPWAFSRISASKAAPSGPNSLNPAEMMIAPGTPASTHSPMTPGTTFAGSTMTARSTFSGTDAMFGYALIPSTLDRLGFTGKTVPPNGLLIRLRKSVRPTLFGDSVAPMTATVEGAKIVFSVRLLDRRMSDDASELPGSSVACMFFPFTACRQPSPRASGARGKQSFRWSTAGRVTCSFALNATRTLTTRLLPCERIGGRRPIIGA